MYITILDHNFACAERVDSDLRDLLSYQEKWYQRKLKKWKTTTRFLIDDNGVFYAGLVPFVVDHVKYNVDIRDKRVWPPYQFDTPHLSVPLRLYQIDYLIEALKARRVIVDAETGSGKTVMIAAILATLNLPSLILVPNKTLLSQHVKELSNLIPGSQIGVASGEKVEEKQFMVGLASTMKKFSPSRLRQFQVLIVDEAHTCAAQQAHDLILTTRAPFRFGFTGTAKGRSDNRDLVVQGLLGPIMKLIEPDELREQGYLASMMIEIHRGAWDGDFSELERLLIVENKKRNDMIVKIANSYKGTKLILVKRLEHGRILSDMLPHSVFVSGEVSGEERENIRQQVIRGDVSVLIASNVFSMGLDIPNLEVGINAAGGKAEILTSQRLGRLNRPWNEVVKKWIDIFDDYHETLRDHSKERLSIYKQKVQSINFIGFPPGEQRRLEDE